MDAKRISLPLSASAAVGAVAAFLAPGNSTAAVYHFQVKMHAGGSGTTEYLTCGWHDTGNRALDWGNSNEAGVLFRSQGYCSRGCVTVGKATAIQNDSPSCKRVAVDIKSNTPSGVLQGTIYYTHTYRSGSAQFNIAGGSSSTYLESQWTRYQVGQTVRKFDGDPVDPLEDYAACPTDGGHVHEYDGGGSKWYQNNPGPEEFDPFPDGDYSPWQQYSVEQAASMQTRLSWSWTDEPTPTPTPSK